MTTEEKAKAYDEALEAAQEELKQDLHESGVWAIKRIFPQLRESEDERIRQKLMWLLQQDICPFPEEEVAQMVAYLEKQKEPTTEELYAEAGTTEKEYIANTMKMVRAMREKQKEQKQNQSEEEREYVKTIKGLISDFIRDSGGAISDVTYYQRICDWLDERHIEQKPAEYLDKDKVYATMKKLHDLSFSQLIPINSDEYKKIDEITCDIRNFLNYPIEQKPLEKQDYSGLTDLERAIHRCFLIAGVENVPVTIIKETAQDCLAQMKPAWSEEDAVMLNCCISSIEEAKENRYAYKETDGDTSYDHEIAWLKSLRPQPHWKPSEELMGCLERVMAFKHPEPEDIKGCEELLEQLQKLM